MTFCQGECMLSTPRTPILSLDSFALRGSIAKPRLHIKSGASKWGFLEQGSCKKNIKEKHPKDPKGPLIRGCIIRGFLAKKIIVIPKHSDNKSITEARRFMGTWSQAMFHHFPASESLADFSSPCILASSSCTEACQHAHEDSNW